MDVRPVQLNKMDVRPVQLNKMDVRPVQLNKMDVRPVQLNLNLLKCFSPIHLLQLCFGSLRVSISDQSVTYNTAKQRLYRLATDIVGTYTAYQIIFIDCYKAFSHNPLVYVTIAGSGWIFHVSHFMNIINVSYFNQFENVFVYYGLQKVDDFLELGALADLNDVQYYFHFCLVYVPAGFTSVGGIMFFYLVFGYVPAIAVLAALGTIYIYIEVVLMAGLVFYLTKRLKFLKTIFLIKISRHGRDVYMTRRKKILLDKRLLPVVDSVVDKDLAGYAVCLNDIITTFNITAQIYRFQLFLYLAVVFFWSFLVIASTIEGDILLLISWIALGMFYFYMGMFSSVLIGVVIICHSYRNHMKELRSICIRTLERGWELNNDPVRILVKKMLRLMENETHVISLYGIVDVDLGLPLKMTALVANFAIVLMQFTIL